MRKASTAGAPVQESAPEGVEASENDVVSRHQPDGTYTYVSDASTQVLGYTPDDLIGRSMYEFFHPNDLLAVMNQQADGPDDALLSYRVRRKDGTYISMETQRRVVREGKDVREMICISRDASSGNGPPPAPKSPAPEAKPKPAPERPSEREAPRPTPARSAPPAAVPPQAAPPAPARAADGLADAQMQLIHALAEELRAPVTPLRRQLRVLSESTGESAAPDEAHALARITREVDRIARIAEDLAEIARATRPTRHGTADASAITTRALATIARTTLHDVEVARDIEEGLHTAGDEDRTEDALRVALAVAARCSAPGDTLDVSLKRHGAEAHLRISGMRGARPDALAKCFAPFDVGAEEAFGLRELDVAPFVVLLALRARGGDIETLTADDGTTALVVRLPMTAEIRR